MITLIKTNASHPDFQTLVGMLDADLAVRDGEDHAFYAQFNKTGAISHAIVAYAGSIPVGCGAIKSFDNESMEVKRMFTHPQYRQRGIASNIIMELESQAREMGMERCVLETGKNQPEAIAMYTRLGYSRIPNYGPYAAIENSVCFEKKLK